MGKAMSENTNLHKVLEQGETIRWSGTPQPYSLFDESRKNSTIFTLSLALVVGIFLVGGYYGLSATRDMEIKSGVMIFLIFVPLFIIWMPLADKGKVKKLLYAVTDKRAIVVSGSDSKPITMPLSAVDDIRIDNADNSNCHVRVGSAVFKASTKKLPVLAFRGENDSEDNQTYKGLVFFNVRAEDGKAIHNLLKPAAALAKE